MRPTSDRVIMTSLPLPDSNNTDGLGYATKWYCTRTKKSKGIKKRACTKRHCVRGTGPVEVRGAEGDSDLISIVIDWRNNIQFRVSQLWAGHKWRDGLTRGSWVHNYGLIKLEAPSGNSGKSEMPLSNKVSQRGRSSSIASIDSVSALCLLTNV